MSARTALRVIKRTFDNDDEVIAQNRNAAWGGVSEEEAVMGAYRTLAEEMGASLEVTLDGQVVLYTGYFKPSAKPVIHQVLPATEEEVTAAYAERARIAALDHRHDLGYIEARDLTPEEEAAMEDN